MNKIYKVLWSKTRNCYVVVSEFAKRSGKCSSSLNKKIIAAFLAAGAVMSVTGSAWADSVESDFFKATGDTEATASTTKSVAAGNAANAEGTYSVAVGNAANSAGVASVAIGTDSVATNNSAIAIGNGAEATGASGLESSLAIGAGAKATADSTLAIGHAAKAKVSSSYAIGFDAVADASHAIAFGTRASVTGGNAVAIGVQADATKEGAIAIGSGSNATGTHTVAIGFRSDALGEDSIKIGTVSLRGVTDWIGSVSIGNSSAAVGQWYSTATGFQSLALNDSSSTYGAASSAAKNSVAIGAYSHAGTEDEDLGGFTLPKEIEGATNATAVGYNTNASGKYSSAIGSGAQATKEYATATGVSSQATGWGSSALGGYSKASNTYATATGMSSVASGYGASALGAQSQATNNYALAAGNKAVAEGEQSTAVGYTGKASGKYATALGAFTNYSGNDSEGTTAVGYNSAVTVKNGVALGRGSVADTEAGVDTETSGYDPATGEASTKTDKVWQSKLGAVSVGNSTSTRQITNVAAGYEDTDAVNVAQLKAAMTSAGGVEIKPGSNISVDAQKKEGGGTVYTISSTASGGSNVKVINGKNTTVTEGKEGNFVTYAVDVMTDGKVTSGDTGIVTGETVFNEVRVKKDGNYIKKDNTAAENITELDKRLGENTQNITNIYNDVNNLDNRMKKGLAGAAALAALHPMDFNPDDKLQFSAGVGNYRGETAAALGAFYRPDESVMFSIGGTFGNADNMVNAGITFGLDGTRNRTTRSRTAMAKEIVELREHIAKQDEQIAQLTNLVNKLVAPEQRLENPFEPEQGRIYVERISGQDNDQNKIERVRVNNSDSKYPEGKNRDVYGSKIQPVVSGTVAGK